MGRFIKRKKGGKPLKTVQLLPYPPKEKRLQAGRASKQQRAAFAKQGGKGGNGKPVRFEGGRNGESKADSKAADSVARAVQAHRRPYTMPPSSLRLPVRVAYGSDVHGLAHVFYFAILLPISRSAMQVELAAQRLLSLVTLLVRHYS